MRTVARQRMGAGGRRRRAAVLAAGTVAALALAGCTGDPEVASLDAGGTEGAVDQIKEQARRAGEYLDCLTAAGIPAQAEDIFDDGQLFVDIVPEEEENYIVSGGGQAGIPADAPMWLLEMAAEYDPSMTGYIESLSGGEVDGAAASQSAEPEGPVEEPLYLIIGQTDFTEQFRGCLESSGYTQPENYPDPDQEVANKEAYLQATLDWIDCARKNGYPDIKDPLPVKADEYETEPRAVLPADMTEQALRDLLAVCPNFDEPAYAAYMEAFNALEYDERTPEKLAEIEELYPWSAPNIGFDLPGLDGDYRPGRPTDAPAEHPVYALFDILREKRAAYDEAHPDPHCC